MDREINKETRVIDRSTMKRSEYITWHLFYIIVALVLANRLLFVTLPRLSAIQSRLILVFAIILISLVFSIPRWKRNRTQIAVIEDVIIGLIFIPEGEWNTTGRTLAELTHEERVTTIVGVKACIDGVMRTDHIMVTVNNGKFVSIMFEKH